MEEEKNIFWCDNCQTVALSLDEIFNESNPDITWCPICGRLQDENGTITPRDSKSVVQRIAVWAQRAIDGDPRGIEHCLHQILLLSAGEGVGEG